jgi:hypothetical protein
MKNGVFDDRKHSNTEALLLCGMFALSARHSSNPWFHSIPAPDRGQAFMEKANAYYEKCQSDQAPSLEYLQGCILLAAYEYASGPSHRAWILAGVCVRLAYDLNLCSMDEQDEAIGRFWKSNVVRFGSPGNSTPLAPSCQDGQVRSTGQW